MSSVSVLQAAVDRFGAEEWQRVYDTTPIGHTAASRRFRGYERIAALGSVDGAEKLGSGRVNFLSYCGSRLGTAIRVLDEYAAGRATEMDVIAGYGPFMILVPPSAIGLGADIVDLWDHARRKDLLARFARVLPDPSTPAGMRPESVLPDTVARIELAICLESVHGSAFVAKRDLGAWLVDLCQFSDAGRPPGGGDLLKCQQTRLAWLGHAEAARDVTAPFASGADAIATARRTTGFNEWIQGLALIWSSIGALLLVFAGQIAGVVLVVVGILAILLAFGLSRLGARASDGRWRRPAEALGIVIAVVGPPALVFWIFWR